MSAVAAAIGASASAVLLGAALPRGSAARPLARIAPEPSDARSPGSHRRGSARLPVAAVAAAGAAVGALVAGLPGLVGGALAGGAVPHALRRRRIARRAQQAEEQLLDAVMAIASAVRSGRSLPQALAVAAGEVGRPLGDLLADAADRAALGIPVDAVLESFGERVGGSDARLVAGVLRLHRRTGGALASSLDELGRTLRARRDGARELRSLTAQARLSATILGLLPLGFFLFLSVVARQDVEAAYRSGAGGAAIAVGLALQGAAFVWIRRLLRVEGP